ncbi:retropepsin-like aspartic protease family protein [Novosphingobium album (ex Hu et al. 2023)]|uniref:TIGR02281 family clan AA aspartic protease n=1 Tax=Novosphingobium album (ex Hu et al. 2023) TaxID=2930093 RepID=A0ABT0AYX2_9SPHN|nr:TIGR02281 family clan AA aspartic protease [Novosphingobium album (ex Hu et al. 2023)]MCJ2177966.1 TIGR02281 family clan AA aspartic protease [Novosphingobium album (ex Hu et al. 2023)]
MGLRETLEYLSSQPLLALALGGIFVSVFGGMMRRGAPILGGFLRGVGNLGLLAVFLLTIAQVTRFTTGTDIALPQLGMPSQSVEGQETRVPMQPDGHFWIRASVNGVKRDFLVDTGATLTAISPGTANRAEIQRGPLDRSVLMHTANGTIQAQVATIDKLRMGNIVARQLDAVVAPGLGDANVIGMNLLSRLASWRVENNTLILVPHHPQAAEET